MSGRRMPAASSFVVDAAALSERLEACPDAASAARETTDTLVAAGFSLPSVYVERGGRLRCLAERGYWQVQDGIKPGIGIIGRSFSTGQAMVVRPQDSAHYVEAAPDVEWEVCVPVTVRGLTVGVVNVEGLGAQPDGALDAVSVAATCFGQRLEELPAVPESAGERLSRAVISLAQLTDSEEVVAAALDAARELSGMPSAALVRFEDGPRLAATAGPLAAFFGSLATEDWTAVARWVERGSSSYTVAHHDGIGFVGHDVFRGAGAHTIVVIPLVARQEHLGLLLVARSEPVLPGTGDVERLEILATQIATCLLTTTTMTELRDRASRDPLTGLGHQASFRHALNKAFEVQPFDRRPAVLLIDVDHFKQVNDTRGHMAGDRTLVEVATALAAALRDEDALFRIGGDEFAGVVHVRDDAEALSIARRLWSAARRLRSSTVSIGVAVSVAEEEPDELLARADDALYAVKAAGRDGVRMSSAGQRRSTPLLPGHLLGPA